MKTGPVRPTHNNLLELSTLTGSNGTNTQYVFDGNGNRIDDDLFRYQYDVLDNLVRVVRKSNNTVVLEQAYDGQGPMPVTVHGAQSSANVA